MADIPPFSPWFEARPESKTPEVRTRVAVARKRIQSILDRDTVSHQKTLEQKIAEQGPETQRVDPHLIGPALNDLLQNRRLRRHTHTATKDQGWFSNLTTLQAAIDARLAELAPLYASVSGSGFGNLTGDALELITFRCLDEVARSKPAHHYLGSFDLNQPKNKQGRFLKTQPPKVVGTHRTKTEADFIQFGYDEGGLCIECKNYREWLYPHHGMIKELIIKSAELNLLPTMIHRRIHYTTRTNFFEPAGIIAHESYFQYYPSDQAAIADRVRNKRSLGFTDVRATEDPDPRTRKFFTDTLPRIVPHMAKRWTDNKAQLLRYAHGEINLAQLYTEIRSPAGGKWNDFEEDAEETPF